MACDDRITALVLEAQQRIFRLADRDFGLSLKSISLDSGIPYNSIRGYASGHTVLPVPALLKLVGVVPDALLSHLLDPVERHIAPNDNNDSDLDELADAADELAADVRRARHPNSPGGVNIVPIERSGIVGKAKRFGATAKAVSA